MEFQFRAGEEKQASLYSDDFFAYPTMGRGAMHPKPTLEELKRQLEEERLKEEILKRKIAHRRMIEEELRRESEMMMMSGAFQRIPIITPLKVMEFQEGFGAFHLRKEEVSKEKSPPLHASPSEFLSIHDETKATSQKLAGTKRKTPGSLSEIGNYKFPQSALKEWSCALCEITMASEDELNGHLKGKKHIELVTELSSGKKTAEPTTKDNSPSSASVKSQTQTESQRQGVEKVCIRPNRQVEDDSEKNEQMEDVIQKGIYLWCMICGVKCTSQIDLDKHLSGKKHKLLNSKKSGWKAEQEVERVEELQEAEGDAVAEAEVEMEEEEGGNVVDTENESSTSNLSC